jgi:glycosyltransferase involved in cell wall biosynthesis
MEMIRKADLVVANSDWLAKYAGQWNPQSVDIGQGCELESFAGVNYAEPQDMVGIPRPIIGYCGAITSMRLDESLLIYIADTLPNMSVVLVGPTDSYFEKSILNTKRNIFFLGPKKPEQTPAYIQHFTICVNPQSVNPLTIGNYPRKIDEYLASGKPVVATETQAMIMFRDHVSLSRNKEEFVMNIQKLLEDPVCTSEFAKEARREFALTHTWENSIGELGNAFYSLKKNFSKVEI